MNDNASDRERLAQLSLRRKLKRNKNMPDESASRRERRRKKRDIALAADLKPAIRDAETARPFVPQRAKAVNVGRKDEDCGMKLDVAQREAYITFLNEMFGLGVNGIVQQYNTYLKTYMPSNITHVAFDKNMSKNRYKDVVCVDKTRVILRAPQDYIHANYVNGPPFLNTFICTQGPMKTTTDDFWEMVVQENAAFIFMLCNTVEGNKRKCFQYWPLTEGSTLVCADVAYCGDSEGDIFFKLLSAMKIRNIRVDNVEDPNFITTSLSVTKNNETIRLRHVRWKNWPDKGVPKNDLAPFRLLKLSREETKRPTIVHCSAGIGRTGTIVAIEMGLQQILAAHPLDIVHSVQQLRNMRMNSVQTEQQLIYIVKCLISYAWTCGIFSTYPDLIKKSEKFDDEYGKMLVEDESKRAIKKSTYVKKVPSKLKTVNEKLEALRLIEPKRSAELWKKIPESSTSSDDKGSSSPDFLEKPTQMLPMQLIGLSDENAKKPTSPQNFCGSERRKVNSQRKTKSKASTSDEQQMPKSSIVRVRRLPHPLQPFSAYN